MQIFPKSKCRQFLLDISCNYCLFVWIFFYYSFLSFFFIFSRGSWCFFLYYTTLYLIAENIISVIALLKNTSINLLKSVLVFSCIKFSWLLLYFFKVLLKAKFLTEFYRNIKIGLVNEMLLLHNFYFLVR